MVRIDQARSALRPLTSGWTTRRVSQRLTALEGETGVPSWSIARQQAVCPHRPGKNSSRPLERMESGDAAYPVDVGHSDEAQSGVIQKLIAPDGFGILLPRLRWVILSGRYPGFTIRLVPLPKIFSVSNAACGHSAITLDRPEEPVCRICQKVVDHYRLASLR